MKGKILALVALASLVALAGCPTTAPTNGPTPTPVAYPETNTTIYEPGVHIFDMAGAFTPVTNIEGDVTNIDPKGITNYTDDDEVWYGGWNGSFEFSVSNDATDGEMFVIEATALLGWGAFDGGFALFQRPDSITEKKISLAGVANMTFEMKSDSITPAHLKWLIQKPGAEDGAEEQYFITNEAAAANPNATTVPTTWTKVTLPVSLISSVNCGNPITFLVVSGYSAGDIFYIRKIRFENADGNAVSRSTLNFWSAW